MSWTESFIELALWALQNQDARHRFLFASSADDISNTPGVSYGLETTVVLAIYEAAIAKGFKDGATVAYEVAYPGVTGRNPPRADLAFKDEGPGRNWCYVEAKRYDYTSRARILSDIDKLKGIKQRSQRWMFLFRVRPTEGKSPGLAALLEKNFGSSLVLDESLMRCFQANADYSVPGICELALCRVR